MLKNDNKLVDDFIKLLKKNKIKIEKEGNILKINGENYVFPSVNQIKQSSTNQFR